MSTIRITEYMRDEIKNALLERAFSKREAELDKERRKLGEDIYRHLYPAPLLRKMKALPNGFLLVDNDQQCKFGGDWSRVSWGENRLVARDYKSNAQVFDANHPFTDRFRDLKKRREALNAEMCEARGKANAALKSATTLKRLVEIWPEVKPFVQKYLNKAKTKAQLPVVQTDVLNKTFGLPVEPVAKVPAKKARRT